MPESKQSIFRSLYFQVLLAISAGIILGAVAPSTGASMKPLGDGFIWLAAKMSFVLFCFLWVRASFPRYRYDQVMRLGWKVFIPVTLIWIVFLGAMMQTRWAYLFH